MITNWLVRGDTHGQFTWMNNGCLDNYKPGETAIIILGDAGFNYYLNKYDDKKKAEVNARGYRFYCVRGNHEARPQDTSCGYDIIYDEENFADNWVSNHHNFKIIDFLSSIKQRDNYIDNPNIILGYPIVKENSSSS